MDMLSTFDRLDVDRLSIEYTADAFKVYQSFNELYRHARDQWLRAAPAIPWNMAEANGKRRLKDRTRFLDICSGLCVGMCGDSRSANCIERIGYCEEYRV